MPDALAAVPAAVLVVVVGLVSFDDALDVLDRLLPTLVFLASIFVIAEAVRAAGLFERAGAFLSRGPHTSVRRLLVAISLAAVAVTTVMSLDATAVLFTPVVIGLVRSRHIDSERPLLVTTQLANAGVGPVAGVEPHQPARLLGDGVDLRRVRSTDAPAHGGCVGGRGRGSSAGVLVARARWSRTRRPPSRASTASPVS